jgi:hypothetical protein
MGFKMHFENHLMIDEFLKLGQQCFMDLLGKNKFVFGVYRD